MTTERPVNLLELRDLRVHFPVRYRRFGRVAGQVHAVDDVSFDIPRGTTLGLVGESGCGKTTVARAILRLVDVAQGAVRFEGVDVLTASNARLRRLRRRMQMIFQDPFGSLNPRMRIGDVIAEPLVIHRVGPRHRRKALVAEVMECVGLPATHMDRYAHEFSGGQRQRIGIARAIVLRPKLVICDEPVSALDVSVQARILNLLSDLQQDLCLTYLFITHNLAVVEHFADRVAVMYLGKIVESAPATELCRRPCHPYSIALIAAVPRPDPTRPRGRIVLAGDVPSPINPPKGCRFHPRCPFATDECRQVTPQLRPQPGVDPEHKVACHCVEAVSKSELAASI